MLEVVCGPSASIFSSPEEICRDSEKESLLDFPVATSPGPSEDNVNAGGPDEEPNNRRTTGTSAAEAVEGLYVATGWSNLQLGPNLHIPYRE